MQSIKAIIFDFDATLGKGKLDEKKMYRRIYKLLKDSYKLPLNFQKYDLIVRNYIKYDNERRMSTQVESTINIRFSNILQLLHITHTSEILQEIYKISLDCYSFELYSSTLKTLETLYSGYYLSIVSNTINGTTKFAIEKYNLSKFFKVVIQSCDVGIRKPNPKIFQIALDILKTDPENAISVGNSPYFDIYGAQQIGMHTIQIRTELSYREPKCDFNIRPDYIINNISELPKILTMIQNLCHRESVEESIESSCFKS